MAGQTSGGLHWHDQILSEMIGHTLVVMPLWEACEGGQVG